MHIAIVGAGSIGCYLGGCLLASGASVTFIGRERLQKELSTYGFHLTDWQGRDARVPPERIQYATEMEAVATADVVLVTVKSLNTMDAGRDLAQHLRPGALVISFQNGLRNAATLRQSITNNLVLAGMVPFNVAQQGKGHFHCGTEGALALEQARGLEKPFVAALASAGLPCGTYADMLSVQWGKLLMNLNNPINALAGIPLVEELGNRAYRRILAQSIREALSVLRSAGVKPARTGKVIPTLMPAVLELPDWLFKKVASAMLKIDPEATSSMQEDLTLGRKTEVDYLNGEIVRLGEELGITTPLNQAILQRIHQAEAQREGSPRLSPQALMADVGG